MLTVLYIASRLFSKMAARGPRPLVICGPSGSGKSTLLKLLFDEYPNTFGFSISHTTRQPRPMEEDGIHYYFVSRDEMQKAIADGKFLEYAEFSGNIYGTSKMSVRQIQELGKVCILDIEVNGVEQIKQTDLNPILVFNNPPSLGELEARLRKRETETEESLARRLAAAQKEIDYGLTDGNFHKIIHNIDIKTAYKSFREYVLNELKVQEETGINICW